VRRDFCRPNGHGRWARVRKSAENLPVGERNLAEKFGQTFRLMQLTSSPLHWRQLQASSWRARHAIFRLAGPVRVSLGRANHRGCQRASSARSEKYGSRKENYLEQTALKMRHLEGAEQRRRSRKRLLLLVLGLCARVELQRHGCLTELSH